MKSRSNSKAARFGTFCGNVQGKVGLEERAVNSADARELTAGYITSLNLIFWSLYGECGMLKRVVERSLNSDE